MSCPVPIDPCTGGGRPEEKELSGGVADRFCCGAYRSPTSLHRVSLRPLPRPRRMLTRPLVAQIPQADGRPPPRPARLRHTDHDRGPDVAARRGARDAAHACTCRRPHGWGRVEGIGVGDARAPHHEPVGVAGAAAGAGEAPATGRGGSPRALPRRRGSPSSRGCRATAGARSTGCSSGSGRRSAPPRRPGRCDDCAVGLAGLCRAAEKKVIEGRRRRWRRNRRPWLLSRSKGRGV